MHTGCSISLFSCLFKSCYNPSDIISLNGRFSTFRGLLDISRRNEKIVILGSKAAKGIQDINDM